MKTQTVIEKFQSLQDVIDIKLGTLSPGFKPTINMYSISVSDNSATATVSYFGDMTGYYDDYKSVVIANGFYLSSHKLYINIA